MYTFSIRYGNRFFVVIINCFPSFCSSEVHVHHLPVLVGQVVSFSVVDKIIVSDARALYHTGDPMLFGSILNTHACGPVPPCSHLLASYAYDCILSTNPL